MGIRLIGCYSTASRREGLVDRGVADVERFGKLVINSDSFGKLGII
jgi:hypothetical protein